MANNAKKLQIVGKFAHDRITIGEQNYDGSEPVDFTDTINQMIEEKVPDVSGNIIVEATTEYDEETDIETIMVDAENLQKISDYTGEKPMYMKLSFSWGIQYLQYQGEFYFTTLLNSVYTVEVWVNPEDGTAESYFAELIDYGAITDTLDEEDTWLIPTSGAVLKGLSAKVDSDAITEIIDKDYSSLIPTSGAVLKALSNKVDLIDGKVPEEQLPEPYIVVTGFVATSSQDAAITAPYSATVDLHKGAFETIKEYASNVRHEKLLFLGIHFIDGGRVFLQYIDRGLFSLSKVTTNMYVEVDLEDGTAVWTHIKIPTINEKGEIDGQFIPGSIAQTYDETLKFNEYGELGVNIATEVEKDNTLPITAAAVHTTVGNIEILLSTI